MGVTWVQVSGMAGSFSPDFHGTTKFLNSFENSQNKNNDHS